MKELPKDVRTVQETIDLLQGPMTRPSVYHTQYHAQKYEANPLGVFKQQHLGSVATHHTPTDSWVHGLIGNNNNQKIEELERQLRESNLALGKAHAEIRILAMDIHDLKYGKSNG